MVGPTPLERMDRSRRAARSLDTRPRTPKPQGHDFVIWGLNPNVALLSKGTFCSINVKGEIRKLLWIFGCADPYRVRFPSTFPL